ncbi:GGDEF domain-containing protein [Butyrivibrio sp. LB2008]|uniref:GGDEF domain-containing protein n=1 Tax=Butyrivibrio sp. LB2008 TaxID=1408305 RepID=UPI00047C74BC|nr:GGDEF domain-containing protein [Butyrivibrio sp. LB2008]
MNKKYSNSLRYRVIWVCLVFIIILCMALGTISFMIFKKTMMDEYRTRLTYVTNYTIKNIDVADLEERIATKEYSDTFNNLVDLMGRIRESYDLDFILLTVPCKVDGRYDCMQIASGLTESEKSGEDVKEGIPIPYLGDMIGSFLGEELCEISYNVMKNNEGINYTTAKSDYGEDFSASVSIRNASGEGIALFSCGFSTTDIDTTLRKYIITMAVCGIVLALIFICGMILWLNERVIVPLQKIERTARDFANNSHSQKNPELLLMENPDVHTGDELESLADTIFSMSQDMREYAEDLMRSSNKIQNMSLEMTKVNEFALRDALTGVKNKAAYDKVEIRLNSDIITQTAQFGMLMIDINYLKKINDTFGHEAGDLYIKNMCTLICDTFENSPVFRIGGDEFVVLLENKDFNHKDELIDSLKSHMEELQSNKSLQPWERISAAIGLAIYDESMDDDADSVLKRADRLMYQNKKDMKAVRI